MISQTEATLYRLSNLDAEQKRVTYQTSTGRKIDNGSEDSALHQREIFVDDRIRTYTGIKKQIERTTVQNSAADSAMSEMKKMFDFIKVELIKANTDTTSEAGLKAIANGIEGVKESIYDLANTQIEGEYVFSGSNSSVQAFTKNTDGSVEYNGNNEIRRIVVEDGSYRERGINGFDMMMYNVDSAGPSETLSFQADNRIIDQDGSEWIMKEPTAVNPATILFSASQQIIDSDDKVWTLNTTTTPGIPYLDDGNGNTISVTAPILPSVDYTLTVPGTTEMGINELVKIDADGSKSVPEEKINVTGSSSARQITIPDVNGNRFEAKQNIFDILDEIVNGLNKIDSDGNAISNAAAKAIVANGQGKVDLASDEINIAHAELGGKNKVFELANERISSKLTQYTILSQEIGGADLATAAIEAKALELTYTALYSTISKTNQLSLVNFLN
jgi:flagellar hook-associated protein 3 FlgL